MEKESIFVKMKINMKVFKNKIGEYKNGLKEGYGILKLFDGN